MMSDICVVHLVRAANGLTPLQAFLDSYREHEAGVSHDLLLVFKGFAVACLPDAYRGVLDGLPSRQFFVPDHGFDLGAYFRVVRALPHRYFCFLNSYSVLLEGGWLEKMYRHITREGVGLVGATGSYEGWNPGDVPMPPFPWRLLLGALRRFWFRTVAEVYRARQELRYLRAHFGGFPNPHIRTNGFMASRDVLLRVRCPRIRSKLDAWRFEHGKDGLTRRILALGLRPLVVGKDGQGYEMGRWFESHSFRSGEQGNLLIADNQTRYYTEADPETRQRLTKLAWGERGALAATFGGQTSHECVR